MYYNVSNLMGVQANIKQSEFYKVNNTLTDAQKKILLDKLIKEFKNFYIPRFSVLTFDFVVTNHELGYFSSIIITVSYNNQGYSLDITVETAKVHIFITVKDYIRTAVEFLFILVTLITLIHIIFYDYKYAKDIAIIRDREDFLNKEKNNVDINMIPVKNNVDINMITETDPISDIKNAHHNNKDDNNLKNNQSKSMKKSKSFDNTISEKKKHRDDLIKYWTWLQFFISLREMYFRDFINIIRNKTLFLSIITMTLRAIYVSSILMNGKNFSLTETDYNVVLNFEFSDSLIIITNKVKGYVSSLAVLAILIIFGLLKIFNPIFTTLTTYQHGFRKSLPDILSFFMLFFLILFGISLILYFYYSVEIDEFDSLTFALLNNLYFFIGTTDFTLVSKMFNMNAFFTIIYFLAVGLFIKYAFAKILLAVILYHFDGLKYSKGKRYEKVSLDVFKKDKNVKQNIFYGFYCSIKQLPNICLNDTEKRFI